MNFKNCPDEEDSPVPEEIRMELQMFHSDLLAHCGQSELTLTPLYC